MSGLYELNEVIDEFIDQVDDLKKEVILKSGVVVVSISTLAFVVGK